RADDWDRAVGRIHGAVQRRVVGSGVARPALAEIGVAQRVELGAGRIVAVAVTGIVVAVTRVAVAVTRAAVAVARVTFAVTRVAVATTLAALVVASAALGAVVARDAGADERE